MKVSKGYKFSDTNLLNGIFIDVISLIGVLFLLNNLNSG